MKTIIPENNIDLKNFVHAEINKYGNKCDLNHIDVSKLEDLGSLFNRSQFDGDISRWDVSNVTNMMWLFYGSKFNGDISDWNLAKVKDMGGLFSSSQFNGDISRWDVSNVTNMMWLFSDSKFNGDISSWKPLKLEKTESMFLYCSAPAPAPYWFGNSNKQVLKNIESYDLFNKINSELTIKKILKIKKIKI